MHFTHDHLSLDINQNKSCKLNFHDKSTLKAVAVFSLQMPQWGPVLPQTVMCYAVRDVIVSGRDQGCMAMVSTSTAAALALSTTAAMAILP